MRYHHHAYLVAALALQVLAADPIDDTKHPHIPCTIRSPTSNAFFDLNKVFVTLPDEGKKITGESRNTSWPARGYDYGANFTLNFCGSVVEKLHDVVGVDEDQWRNVSAFYEMHGKTYSIGQQNAEPIFRGRKLVLNYTDGSPCPDTNDMLRREIIDEGRTKSSSRSSSPSATTTHRSKSTHASSHSTIRRKTTIINLLCASDPLAPTMALSFVASPDHCSYFFEARTPAACGGIEKAKQQLGPGGVFSVIATIAILVYVIGGCVYSRTVLHQRGWRQLPNYSFWAAIGGFIKDMFIILTSSCTSRLWSRKTGYNRISTAYSDSGTGRRGPGSPEDENRLIDQLDEEWED